MVLVFISTVGRPPAECAFEDLVGQYCSELDHFSFCSVSMKPQKFELIIISINHVKRFSRIIFLQIFYHTLMTGTRLIVNVVPELPFASPSTTYIAKAWVVDQT